MNLTLGSLFDGSGTAPFAASLCGITPVWASEIEPYPIRVTTKRFPNMLHMGSITDIDGAKVEPVDIICGGSPCQDLSVAGKQAGLDGGARSHLFYEMTRIIKEMRKASNGKYPRFIVWENVPGAFSSNNGRDFLSVLRSFAEIAEADVYVPEPERKADKLVWRNAGEVVGYGWSIAWRTVDSQYWGVPQRRRRIYLVVDLDSECAGEILFERKSLSGNIEPCSKTRKGTAADSESGVGGSCYPTIARCLTAEYDASPCVDRGQNICVYGSKSALEENWTKSEVKNALRANASKSDHCFVQKQNRQHVFNESGRGYWMPGFGCLRAEGENRPSRPSVCIVENASAFMGGQGAKARSIAYCDDGTAPSGDYHIIVQNDVQYIVRRLMPLECSRLQGFPDCWELDLETKDPSEEEVEFWSEVFETHRKVVSQGTKPKTRNQIVKWLRDPYSDSASYKMWGNGMAFPNMLHVMKGIVNLYNDQMTVDDI